MQMNYEVFSPWAEVDEVVSGGLQPRVTDLNKKTIGLFSFFKEHGPMILREVERQLKEKFPEAKFSHFQYPKDCVDIADDDEYRTLLEKWLKGVDTVLSGHGDATSCTLFLTYNTALMERLGKPTVILMHRHFENIAQSGSSARGVRGIRVVKTDIQDMSSLFSLDGVVDSIIKPGIAAVIDDIVAALTMPITPEEKSLSNEEEATSGIVFKGSLQDVNRHFYKNGWTQGLPIIPPTEEAVREMLSGTDLPADDLITKIPPMSGKATVEKIAINAVMAGCLPTYLPVLIAAVKALMDYPKLELGVALEGYTCSVASWAPLLILNGPIRNDLHVNSGVAAFSPYYMANNAIGHALGLILMNIGGLRPGKEDMSSIGHEGRNGMCIAENEELSPWESLHVGKGLNKDDSTVTIFWPNSRSLLRCGDDPAIILRTLCDNIDTFGFNPGCGIFMGPTIAKVLSDNGFAKKDVLSYILEYSRKPAANVNLRWIRGNSHMPKTVPFALESTRSVRRIFDPDHLMLVVIGESYHRHVALYGGGGDHGGPVTKKIDLPVNWSELVNKYREIVPTYARY
jgi:hypothetical protein